ncbi:MarR family transcriptional regulator [Nonomuraea sp. NPDC046802]|uniref:MarR family winged helix-turn-helix transcriptional regulator n=1 Tax=Nonomuraea sp. NPDC046802 TaxID=3154919 RepID=UPI0033C280CA
MAIEGPKATGPGSINETEKLVQARLGGLEIQQERMAMVANIYRAAASIRQHVENSVLRPLNLTWTGFVVLWVVWIWGESETRHVAEEAGISKGTLTGVARTLEERGLLSRADHPTDGRLVLIRLTREGEELMQSLFPAFHAEEAFVTALLDSQECKSAAESLRKVVRQLEENGEERRGELLNGKDLAPRRSGRRARS